MANQTVTTVVNYDDPAISGLLDGETLAIDGGEVTVDSDVRWNQQAAVFGAVTLSPTLGGSFLIDGTKVWEVPFSASSGNVPTQDVLGSNGVTGGTSGATGELLRVWATGSLDPATAGGPMPATGWIKLRSKTGTFANGETITLPGGATVTASGVGKRSWIHVVGRLATALTIPRLGNAATEGDWYELGLTDGTDNQQLQFPVLDECPAVQVETAPGSNSYEWWSNAGGRWINTGVETQTVAGTTAVLDNISGPQGALPGGRYSLGVRLRETATTAPHGTGTAFAANNYDTGLLTFRAWVRKETRRWVLVQAHSGSNRFGALVDLDNGTIIANPTVGSPTGTSSAITSYGDGWYLVELTLNHVQANAGGINIYLSNSATPTYDANGFPSYLGATTQGVYYAEPQILHPTTQQVATDERGKFFYSDATTGTLTFAKRDANYDAGFKPPSGCKVRIPNIILSTAAPVDYSRNNQANTLGSRYDTITTSAGVVLFRNVCCNWYILGASAAQVTLEDSAFGAAVSFSNVAGATTITNCCVGVSRCMVVAALTLANCFSGGTVTDSRFVRFLSATTTGSCVPLSVSAGFTFTNCRTDTQSGALGRMVRLAAYTYSATNCDSLTFIDSAAIGGGWLLTNANNTTITGTKYADVPVGTTLNVAAFANAVVTSDTVTIDGFSAFADIPNVHPYGGIVSMATSSADIEVKNIGTPAAPYDGGTVNAMGVIAALSSTTIGVVLRRVYVQNTRTATFSSVNTIQNVRMFNVWGDGADSQVQVAVDAVAQGCRWTNPSTVQTAVYGTHWEDAFVSETDGRLMIFGNEPIAATANQCSFTFGAGAGFTAAGGISLPNLTDTVTWTMPYYAIGHNSIANFTSGVFTNPWLVTGTNVQFLEFQYAIDTGSGFSAFKHLLNQARQEAGGTSGTNTVTLNATERPQMLRQPQVGDYIQSGSNRLPHGTTITDVTDNVLTLSNNFTSTATASEPILIWKDIVDEVIDPADGYQLRVRVKVNTADATNLMTFLRIPFDTDATTQQLQYPLPVISNIGEISNIRPGSRLQVFNVTTDTEVVNEVVAGSTFTYLYEEGTEFTDGDLIRVRLARCLGSTASIGFEGFAVANPDGWSLFAAQDDDTVYNSNGIDGTTITEFVFDYPNIEIDINDPDGTTTITRLYAWFANERTSEQGIRTLIGGLVAEDEANYKVNTSRIDLKLDNIASTGVIFTGDLRLYRDDGLAPVVSSTTGGGSITLYAGKVYTVATGGSALTPTESAKLLGLPDSAATATAVRGELEPELDQIETAAKNAALAAALSA